MSAAELVDVYAGRDGYSARILAAVTANDMHDAAATIAADRTVPDDQRARLQLLFASRVRQLWPAAFRRGRS